MFEPMSIKDFARITLWGALVLVVAIAPGLALAQGLEQTFQWPEKGFAISYPAGWVSVDLQNDTYGLQANPNDDLNEGPPTADAVVIVALDTASAAAIGGPAEALQLFADEFAPDSPITVNQTTVAGYNAVRAAIEVTDENAVLDIVVLSTDAFTYIIIGATPTSQAAAFKNTFNAMLATIVITEPVGGAGAGMVAGAGTLYSGVRITLDQTITQSWNEIDAVELVGADASGVVVRQWAIAAEATSSYGTDAWSAAQATGAPDTPACGDYRTAWASATSTGQDTLTLHYGTPVAPTEVNIHQTYNPGAITTVELLPADPALPPLVIFRGLDDATPCPGILSIPVSVSEAPPSDNVYDGVRITLDQTITQNWNEIDAVELVGADASGVVVRQWAIAAEATSSYGTDSWSAAQTTGAPDTKECGDIPTAWASATSTGQDTLTLHYGTPVTPTEVNIHQTYNPGAITTVELLPVSPSLPPLVIFEGIDPTVDCPGILSIPVTVSPAETGMLDYSLPPSFGSTALVSGFTPDPFTVAVTSGGTVDVVAAMGEACSGVASGYAASAPDFRLQYTAGQYILRFFFVSEGDTTMVINAPDGRWYCDDDTGGLLQPMLTFDPPLSGQYDIWIGSFSAEENITGSLYITETEATPENFQGSS